MLRFVSPKHSLKMETQIPESGELMTNVATKNKFKKHSLSIMNIIEQS